MDGELPPLEPFFYNEISKRNWELKKELWARGYYVQEIGETQAGKIDYLVVTVAPPPLKSIGIIDHTSN
jgi:hypothetical protein